MALRTYGNHGRWPDETGDNARYKEIRGYTNSGQALGISCACASDHFDVLEALPGQGLSYRERDIANQAFIHDFTGQTSPSLKFHLRTFLWSRYPPSFFNAISNSDQAAPRTITMHELYLSATVANDDRLRSLKILQGFCAMNPQPLIRRRLFWEGVRIRGVDQGFILKQLQPKQYLWRQLQEQLSRQSFLVTSIYDVNRDQFGHTESNETSANGDPAREASQVSDKYLLLEISLTVRSLFMFDDVPGTLSWTDIPDPISRGVNSRLAVTIENEFALPKVLNYMGFKFSREIIEDSYRFVRGDITFYLSRYLQLPETVQNIPPKITTNLPPFESLISFDSEEKWILTARVEVMNGSDPVHMKKGIDELLNVKSELEGCFDLQVVDRHIFDTRVRV
ncbi:hypothetical protein B7494_g4760 [Chlorociboria aeruginascens]|nr:hypothetical protein B7494_g4760 [Chlorociboria aeruginascens]